MAAAAIDHFAAEFPRNVVDASTVVVPSDLDIDALRLLLDTPRKVTSAPVSVGTYWEVIGVSDEGEYWQIEMSSVNGPEYFSGSLFFVVSSDGAVEAVDADDVGATQITSVS